MRTVLTLVSRCVVLGLASLLSGDLRAQGPDRLVLQGLVVDVLGSPVGDAAVVVRTAEGTESARVTTDAAGHYRIEVPGLSGAVLAVARDGFEPREVSLDPGRSAQPLRVVLAVAGVSERLSVQAERLLGSEEERRRIPGAFFRLSADDLLASRVFTTSEALRKVPGLVVRDEEGLGLRPNIGIRGLNPTRSSKTLLLEDGVPVAFAPYGDNASYYHPPIERFDRIEVLKGASQITQGPVTLGGVVNYITPDTPSTFSGVVDLTGGNRAMGQAGGALGGTVRGTGLYLQGARKQSDGARAHTHSDLVDVMVKAHRPVGATQAFVGKLNLYDERSQVTYSGLRQDEWTADPRQNPFLNDRFDAARGGGTLGWRGLAAGRVALTATAYGSTFNRDWWRQSSHSAQRPNTASTPGCGGMAHLLTTCGNEGRLRSYWHLGVEVRGRAGWTRGATQELDFGVRAHTEHQDRRQVNGASPTARTGVLVEDNLRTTDAWSAFAQHRLLAGRFTLTPGLRIERISYGRRNQLLGISGTTALTELIPGVGVSVALTKDTVVFGGAHRGFAPPRAEDVISNTTGGTVDLDPERSWNYEAGVRTRLSSLLTAEATAFEMRFSNQIIPASLAGGLGAALTNGGATLQRGGEAALRLDLAQMRGTAHDLYSRVALTWLPVARFTGARTSAVPGEGAVSVSGNRLPYAPEWGSTVTAGYRHRAGLDAQLEWQLVGQQFGDDLNTVLGSADGQRGSLPASLFLNSTVSWRLPRLQATIFTTVKNVDNRLVLVDRTRGMLPGHPRLVQAGVRWAF
jgi:Fe(3+) dicitrate transport protein